ncbi:nitroreductase family protein [Nocardioides sp. zg-536]|uniref:Nitroreductase family protein n=1 Tax=Nocardioides faecalis TaxID=2803858 RepID=A0A938Y999_9ACTN|nr:nitroreductase family protein [Nocardioides faecalis]MBM9461564.1 nitroreductase family protein [Nocardioides faecalis]QVI57802.1 nitroreductase family protein [Nocardioides faecalis]
MSAPDDDLDDHPDDHLDDHLDEGGDVPLTDVEELVGLACLAPSVHNTQPWRWRYDGHTLALAADDSRRLVHSDPASRNLTISCGAALDHLELAARALGYDVSRVPPGKGVLARVALRRATAGPVADADLALLRSRGTDRRRFGTQPVPPEVLDALCDVAATRGVEARAVTADEDRVALEILANRAMSLVDLDAERRAEQRRWIDHSTRDGIPRSQLPQDPDPMQARSRFRPDVVEDARLAARTGDRVIVLGGSVDDQDAWLRAGQALSALWLEATRRGLGVIPMTQPVEVDSVREELARTLLEDAFVPHALVQVGLPVGEKHPATHTPRRPVAEVLEITGEPGGRRSRAGEESDRGLPPARDGG